MITNPDVLKIIKTATFDTNAVESGRLLLTPSSTNTCIVVTDMNISVSGGTTGQLHVYGELSGPPVTTETVFKADYNNALKAAFWTPRFNLYQPLKRGATLKLTNASGITATVTVRYYEA